MKSKPELVEEAKMSSDFRNICRSLRFKCVLPTPLGFIHQTLLLYYFASVITSGGELVSNVDDELIPQ